MSGLSNGRRQSGAHYTPDKLDCAAADPRSLQPFMDRGDPRENQVCTKPSDTAVETPEPLRSRLGCVADRGAPWEQLSLPFPPPTQRRKHPSPSGPA